MGSIASKFSRRQAARQTTIITARALGASLSLLETVLGAKDWDEFTALRDAVSPKMEEIVRMFDEVKPDASQKK